MHICPRVRKRNQIRCGSEPCPSASCVKRTERSQTAPSATKTKQTQFQTLAQTTQPKLDYPSKLAVFSAQCSRNKTNPTASSTAPEPAEQTKPTPIQSSQPARGSVDQPRRASSLTSPNPLKQTNQAQKPKAPFLPATLGSRWGLTSSARLHSITAVGGRLNSKFKEHLQCAL